MKRSFPLLLACFGLVGCATISDTTGRARIVAPSGVGVVYSEVEMQTRLALTPDALCQEIDCAAAEAFRDRVWQLAQRLGPAALQLANEQQVETPLFNVSVPGKEDIGTISTASGAVVVFDGVRMLGLSDPALAFLIAREMGHVIARHHEENTANGIAISVVVALLFPQILLLQGAEAAYAASTVTTGLASSAASFAGARIVRAIYRIDQRREADELALQILRYAGWNLAEAADALHAAASRIGEDGWMGELRESSYWLGQIVQGPPQPVAEPAPDSETVAGTGGLSPLAAAAPAAVPEFVADRLVAEPAAIPPPEGSGVAVPPPLLLARRQAAPSPKTATRMPAPAARAANPPQKPKLVTLPQVKALVQKNAQKSKPVTKKPEPKLKPLLQPVKRNDQGRARQRQPQ